MPSGLSDDQIDAVIDNYLSTLAPNPMWLEWFTTAPTDDNGTGAVSWAQGRTSVDPTDVANWPMDADGRLKTSNPITGETNSSGDTIVLVAAGWYDDETAGNYLGGGPVPGGTLSVPDGSAPVVTATLAGPPPT